MPFAIVLKDQKQIKRIKTEVESLNVFVKPITNQNGSTLIRTSISDAKHPYFLENDLTICEYNFDDAEGASGNTSTTLTSFVKSYLSIHGYDDKIEQLIDCMPLKYTIYEPLLLFNNSEQRSFANGRWTKIFNGMKEQGKNDFFQQMLLNVFKTNHLTHVAINKPIIEADILRRPFNIQPLYGEFMSPEINLAESDIWDYPKATDFNKTLWCHTMQNGIHQFWAPVFTMFSRGNIKEKKRIIDTFEDIEGKDVVDLYSGIGYFTLSYLKRNARNVFCFELNPWSVEGLKRGLQKNKNFKGKAHVYCQDNIYSIQAIEDCPIDEINLRHVNLGLLPTSKPGWSVALKLLESKKNISKVTTLHIHENIHIRDIESKVFVNNLLQELQKLNSRYTYAFQHLEKIKTFAPDVWHTCIDILVQKSD